MRTVWKYKIEPNARRGGVFEIKIPGVPIGGIVRHVGVQDGDVCVWVEVESDNKVGDLILNSVGTGFGHIPNDATYVGTVQHNGFVLHLYRD